MSDNENEQGLAVGLDMESALLGVAVQLAQGWYSSPQSAGGKRMPTKQIVEDARALCEECGQMVISEITNHIAAESVADDGQPIAGTITDQDGNQIPVSQQQIDDAVAGDMGEDSAAGSDASNPPAAEPQITQSADAAAAAGSAGAAQHPTHAAHPPQATQPPQATTTTQAPS